MITQKRLKEVLNYEPSTGIFIWKVQLSSRGIIGSEVTTKHLEGYTTIQIDGKQYLAHRLAWFYVHGYFPDFIDHINHVRDDNRLVNLREVTRTENQQNLSIRCDNVSGVCGVSWDKARNRWTARIKVDDKYMYLGRFAEFSDAVNARKNAEVLYGFHDNHGK